ncbi:MAG: HAD family hydrolase [Candidatus Hodarchaeales archaeon]|jgi:FMN phosphatase YigB (HAD superfamily)
MSKKDIEAIIFDLDQTLFYLTDLWETIDHYALEAMISYLKTTPLLTNIDSEILKNEFIKNRDEIYIEYKNSNKEILLETILNKSISSLGILDESDELKVAIQRALFAYAIEVFLNYQIIPGAEDFLREKQGKVYLGLLCNFTSVESVEYLLRSSKINIFDGIFVSSDKELMIRKPDLKIFKAVQSELIKLNVQPENTLMIGDDVIEDLIPANDMKWKTLHFTQYSNQRISLPWMKFEEVDFLPTWKASSYSEIQSLIS